MPLEWLTPEALASLGREADVEDKIIIPLFRDLGYEDADRAPKVPVDFRYGSRRGRRPEADYVFYSGPDHNRGTSLVTVEAKRPSEPLAGGAEQADFYSWQLRTLLYVAVNGHQLAVYQTQLTRDNLLVFECELQRLAERWAELCTILSKAAVVDYHGRTELPPVLALNLDLTQYLTNALAWNLGACSDFVPPRWAPFPRVSPADALGQSGPAVADATQASLTERLDQHTRIVVLGQSGYGKSTCLRQLFVELGRRRLSDDDLPLPVLVDLADLSTDTPSIAALLQRELAMYRPQVSQEVTEKLLSDGGLILLVDGLNSVHGDVRQEVVGELRRVAQHRPHVHWVAACSAFDYRREFGDCAEELELLGFSDAQQREYLGLGLHERRSRYLARDVAAAFGDLAMVPLFLAMVREVVREEGHLPRSPVGLVGSYARHVLGKRPAHVAAPGGYTPHIEELLSVLARLADKQARRATPRIAFDQVADAVREVSPALQPGTALDHLCAAGLVQRRSRGYAFAHEILRAYFRALDLAAVAEAGRVPEAVQAARSDPVADHAVRFLVGLVDDLKVREELLGYLLERDFARYVDSVERDVGVTTESVRGPADVVSRRYLETYAGTTERMVDTHFAAVKDHLEPWASAPVLRHTAHARATESCLGLIGSVDVERQRLYYALQIHPPGTPGTVRLLARGERLPHDAPETVLAGWRDLQGAGLGVNSARRVALHDLREQFLGSQGVLKRRQLVESGTVLAERVRWGVALLRGWRREGQMNAIVRGGTPTVGEPPDLEGMGEAPANAELLDWLDPLVATWRDWEFFDRIGIVPNRQRGVRVAQLVEAVEALNEVGMEVYGEAPPTRDLDFRDVFVQYGVDLYSDERLTDLAQWFFTSVLRGYQAMVAANFPTLVADISLLGEFPGKAIYAVHREKNERGWDELSSAEWMIVPLPHDSSEAWSAEEVREADIEHAWDALVPETTRLGAWAPRRSAVRVGMPLFSLDPGSPRSPKPVIAETVYGMIQRDLRGLFSRESGP